MMRISIIIPVYNVEHYLERCIKSVESQNIPFDSYEVIAVNDGSTDGSLSLLNSLALQYTNIRIISQDNKGLSEARNTGIKNASGKYIMLVDSDDWIKENCLNTILSECEDNDLDLLRICAANVIENKPIRRFSLQNGAEIISGRKVIANGYQVCAPFTIYKRSLLEDNNISFYPGIFHEDNEFTPRVYYYAQRVGGINDLIYFVYQNPNSITRTTNPKKSFDNIKVAESLLTFAKDKDEEWKKLTNHMVVRSINGCLYDSLNIDVDSQRSLGKELYDKRYLFKCFNAEKTLIHRMQGFLFSLFPRNVVRLYKLFKHSGGK